MIDIHTTNKSCLLIYNDELTGFFKGLGQYKKGGNDRQYILELWNGSFIIVNRVSKSMKRLEESCVSIIGTIQLDPIIELMNGQDDGLIDRFLFTKNVKEIIPLRQCLNKAQFSEVFANNLDNLFDDSYTDVTAKTIMEYEPEVFKKVQEYDKILTRYQKNKNTNPMMIGYIEKQKTNLQRFVILLFVIDKYFKNNLFEELDKITIDQVDRAFMLIKYFISTYNDLLKKVSDKKEIKEIENNMVRKGMTVKEKILELHSKGIKKSDIAKQLKVSKVYVTKITK